MKLSISNIAWQESDDAVVYGILKEFGFDGLEIAPTRVFPDSPYDLLDEARCFSQRIYKEYQLRIPSMQSIWYGRQEKIFGTKEEREQLIDYTQKAILFAEAIGCENIVFGCPRNRNMPDGADPGIAIEFFKKIGDFAYAHGTAIGMEANPTIYNTNFINSTKDALDLIEEVDSKGFKLNLDLGTMIENQEDLAILSGNVKKINHVHISEPGLGVIARREIHKDVLCVLKKEDYSRYVSIEMGKQENIDTIRSVISYLKNLM